MGVGVGVGVGVGSGLALGVGVGLGSVEALAKVGETPIKANNSRTDALTRARGFMSWGRRISRV